MNLTYVQKPQGRSPLRTGLDNFRERSPGLFNLFRAGVYGASSVLSSIRGAFLRPAQVRRYLARHAVPKLHVGCGGNALDGWLNTDRGALAGDIAYVNAQRRLPFASGTFQYIFTEHMIEHIPFQSGVKFVQECFRVLKPGGKLRISTPDLSRIAGLLKEDLSKLESDFVSHMLEQVPGAIGSHPAYAVNLYVRAWGHTFIYDRRVLSDVFRHCGFTDIVVCPPGESADPNLNGIERHGSIYPDPEFNLVETLVVEATKPA